MIRFEQMQNGRWRWSYEEPGKKLTLVSNEDYDDLDEARAAATRTRARSDRRRRDRRDDRGSSRGATRGIAGKIARWLTPVVILIAWSRRKD